LDELASICDQPVIAFATIARAAWSSVDDKSVCRSHAPANPTGTAAYGEVDDYRVTITDPSGGRIDSSKLRKLADNTSGGPTLAEFDWFGGAIASIGDLDGDGVADIAIGASSDDTGGASRGALYVV